MIQPGEIARLAHRLGLSDKTIEKDYNKVDRSELESVLTRKQETFRRLWEPRLQGQMPDLPHLDAVIRETNRWLRQAGIVAE